jgi:hypothetical protein
MATCVLILPPLAAEALRRGHVQAPTLGLEPWPLGAWSDVLTKFLRCRGNRLFSMGRPRRVRERPSIVTHEVITTAVDATASAAASTASSPTW